MKLRDFLAVLRARWLIVVACTLIVAGIAAVFTYRQTPIYTAQASYYVATVPGSVPKDGFNYAITTGDLNTLVAVVGSSTVLDSLRETLDLPQGTPIDASAAVSNDSTILTITARDADPERAAKVANALGPQLAEVADKFSAQLQASGAQVEARPVAEANVPSTPTSPVPSRNIGLGILAGLLVGVGIAFIRHTLDTKVRAEADIRPFSTEPMLGELPLERSKSELVAIDRDPHSNYAEAVRRLRTNLMFVDVTTGRHSFVVTSAMPGEGKTTTTANLAMAMATTGGKVLLIDGDLRNPSVASTLGIEGAVGLTTVLLGEAEASDVIQRWRDTELYILTAGAIPPNPSELLGSEPMLDLFDKLAKEFDFILIDSPPVVPVVDAVLLDRLTGGTLMIVASNKTKKRDLQAAVKQLETVGARLVGFALNFVPVSESDARRYGYYRPDSNTESSRSRAKSRSQMKSEGKGRRRADP